MSKMFQITQPGLPVADHGAVPFIPPHLLLNFVSVCQHKSISHAATVQCMPQTALARNIARLEGIIGMPLIMQDPGRFRLTPAGQRVFDALRDDAAGLQAKVQVALAAANIDDPDQAPPTLALDINIWGFAAALRPYLKDLKSLGCGLNFLAPQHASAVQPDVVCYLSKDPRMGYENKLLFREEIIAVCGATYPVPDEGFAIDALQYEPLLHLGHPDHQNDWQSFLGWEHGIELPGIPKTPYGSFSTYLHALRSDRGLGVGLSALFANDIAQGHLKVASQHRVWRNRAAYVGVAKDSQNIDQARACAMIIKTAFTNATQIYSQDRFPLTP